MVLTNQVLLPQLKSLARSSGVESRPNGTLKRSSGSEHYLSILNKIVSFRLPAHFKKLKAAFKKTKRD